MSIGTAERPINIKDLILEEPERRESVARERLEALERTPLWDAAKGQWNHRLAEDQELIDTGRNTYAQLIGILVEGLFNKDIALRRLIDLKKTQLWDSQRNQWNSELTESQELTFSGCNVHNELLSILVEALFDRDVARQRFTSLRKTSLWDASRNQWNWALTKDRKELSFTTRFAEAQLLGVLVEALFDKEVARQRLHALKKTKLWDASRNQWIGSLKEDQELESPQRSANAQLLGVLVEALFDRRVAQQRLADLKKTSLWDASRNQWNHHLSVNPEPAASRRCADSQLLGILAEHAVKKQSDFTPPTPPMPEVRRF